MLFKNVAEREAGTTYTFGAGTPIRSFLPLDERHRVANFLPYDLSQFFHPAEGGGHYALVSLRMSGPDEVKHQYFDTLSFLGREK